MKLLSMINSWILAALLGCFLATPAGGDIAAAPSFKPPSHPECFCSQPNVGHDCGFARPLSEVRGMQDEA